MDNLTEKVSLQWQIGPWTMGYDSVLLWIFFLFGIISVGCFVYWTYKKTLQPVPRWPKNLLILLRGIFFVSLLLVIAKPTRVKKHEMNEEKRERSALLVLLDRSDSMTLPDNRGKTRIDDALKRWSGIGKVAANYFSKLKYFTFAETVTEAESLDSAAKAVVPGKETKLYQSLASVIKEKQNDGVGGIVCMTDGRDTSHQESTDLVSLAQEKRIPLYFVPCENRSINSSFVAIKQTKVPSEVRVNTEFEWRSAIEGSTNENKKIPISLWNEEDCVAQDFIELKPGMNTIVWSKPLKFEKPGEYLMEMRLGNDPDIKYSSATVKVVDQNAVKVLFYQGCLDWTYRFMSDSLRHDPSFKLTAMFSPTLGIKNIAKSPGDLLDIPTSVNKLEPFQLVILSQINASQLSEDQQKTLIEYTKRGGGILFIMPDDSSSHSLAGSKLEEMLPIIFEPASKESDAAGAADDLEASLNKFRSSDDDVGTEKKKEVSLEFVLTKTAEHLSIFTATSKDKKKIIVPTFTNYARVQKSKPGADTLAVHPTDGNQYGKRILLATQHFGKGLTSILATDGLWHWKMSMSSDTKDQQIFWQQFLIYLAKNSSKTLHFDGLDGSFEKDKPASLVVSGWESSKSPVVTAVSPTNKQITLQTESNPDDEWIVPFTPNEAGLWTFSASDEKGSQTNARLRVASEAPNQELNQLPPDLAKLKEIADATGGELLSNGAPYSWKGSSAAIPPLVISEDRQPLWNHWFFLLVCLGSYATELIVRRRFKLI